MYSNFSYRTVIFIIFLVLFSCAGCTKQKKAIPDGMILIPGGDFTMGTNDIDEDGMAEAFGIPDKWFVDEHPERRVTLKPYYIDKYEVTNIQYEKFVAETGTRPPVNWRGGVYPVGTGSFPVTYINLFDANKYAEWAGKRLPTEAEWEKAARGVDGRLYSWGSEFDESKANLTTSASSNGEVKPVGSFPEGISPFGVHDMIGNVWEWTVGFYDAYPGNKAKKERFGKKFRVMRGFSYYGVGHFPDQMYEDIIAHLSRASYREFADPYEQNVDVGFRCVKDVEIEK